MTLNELIELIALLGDLTISELDSLNPKDFL